MPFILRAEEVFCSVRGGDSAANLFAMSYTETNLVLLRCGLNAADLSGLCGTWRNALPENSARL